MVSLVATRHRFPPRFRPWAAAAALGVLLAMAPAAAGDEILANPSPQTTLTGPDAPATVAAPPAQPPRATVETRPLGPPREHGAAKTNAAGRVGVAPKSDDWMIRTGGALALVVAMIFGVRALLRRLASRAGLAGQIGAGGRAPSGILEVLGRYPIARGQTLVLLRMDRRVLLLSQSSAGFSTLASVDDPDEIASLLLQARGEEGDTMAERFKGLLRSMERDPTIVGESGEDPSEWPTTPRVARGLVEPAPLVPEGAGDPIISLRRRLTTLRGSAA